MKKLLIALTAVALVITACQKEASFEDPNAVPGSGSTGTTSLGLLVRRVEVGSSDSAMYDFGYDGSKRLITYNYSSTAGDFQTFRIYRNTSGIITKYSYKDDGLPSYGIDSLVYTLNYNSANSRYTSALVSFTVNSIPLTDSSAFIYDGSGNLISIANYVKSTLTAYQPTARMDFTYANGNVASEKTYADTTSNLTGTLILTGTNNYTYDNKVNPLILGNEALILMEDPSMFGSNNLTVTDYVDAFDATNNYKVTSTYQYNSSNKPSGGTNAESTSSGTTTLRYYYN